MGICLVRRGNEQWYCPPEQTEYWASQGCTVFELTPKRIAGPEADPDAEGTGPVSAEGSTGPAAEVDETTTPVPVAALGGSNG